MKIYTYADWFNEPKLIGTLYVDVIGGSESYSFEYDDYWLNDTNNIFLDPNISNFRGRQFSNNKQLFGFIMDSCPDRWGRTLINRNEGLMAKKENRKARKLNESDYLLRINDFTRMGALRFKTDLNGEFLDNAAKHSVPPITSIRELEYASARIEDEKQEDLETYIKQILAPGSSLGGARPKANVLDLENNLWIGKFPSKNDDYDVGAFEKVAYDLAALCNIDVSESKIEKYSNLGSTFLCKRFDRNKEKRIHFASAMTLLNKNDGDDASYLDIANFISANCANPKDDLKQLFTRLVFNIAISNYDDHLRNHGFLLDKNNWRLSPAYDLNPTPFGHNLSLSIDGINYEASFELALDTCKYYKLSKQEGLQIINHIKNTVKDNWLILANKNGISKKDIEYIRPAFETK